MIDTIDKQFSSTDLLRIIAFTLSLTLLSGCGRFFFYPEPELRENLYAAAFDPQDVYFTTVDDVRLHAWLIRAKEDKGTILVLHGNAENLSTHINSVLWLVPNGYNIFMFDYRGYGRSEGRPNIPRLQLDADAAIDTLFHMQGINTDRVFVIGQSLGGAVAIPAVARSPYRGRIRALIIDSAFADYRMILKEKLGHVWLTWPLQYPLSYTVNNDYSPLKWVKGVSPTSILIIHSRLDSIVPVHHGRLIYDTANQPKAVWFLESPGHVASFADPVIQKRFLEYLSGCCQGTVILK